MFKMLLDAALSCNDVHLELEDDDYTGIAVIPPLSFKVVMMKKLRMTQLKGMSWRKTAFQGMNLLNLMWLKEVIIILWRYRQCS